MFGGTARRGPRGSVPPAARCDRDVQGTEIASKHVLYICVRITTSILLRNTYGAMEKVQWLPLC